MIGTTSSGYMRLRLQQERSLLGIKLAKACRVSTITYIRYNTTAFHQIKDLVELHAPSLPPSFLYTLLYIVVLVAVLI